MLGTWMAWKQGGLPGPWPCPPEQAGALGRGWGSMRAAAAICTCWWAVSCVSPGRWVCSVAATGPWLLPQGPVLALTSHPSLQGLFVLLFHCALNREVRKHLKGVLAGKKLHPDDSATTRATLLTVGGPQGIHVGPGVQAAPLARGSV